MPIDDYASDYRLAPSHRERLMSGPTIAESALWIAYLLGKGGSLPDVETPLWAVKLAGRFEVYFNHLTTEYERASTTGSTTGYTAVWPGAMYKELMAKWLLNELALVRLQGADRTTEVSHAANQTLPPKGPK